MAPNQATALPPFNDDLPDPVVLGAQLLVDGAIVSRAVLWPKPLKYLALIDLGLLLTRAGETVRLRVQRPVKGLWLDGGDGVQWSDNLLDLLPDEEVTITATGLGDAEIQYRWLGQEW